MYKDLCKYKFDKIIKTQEVIAENIGSPTLESKENRSQTIELIENGIRKGIFLNKFYLIFDIRGSQITWSSSAKKYTGYPNEKDKGCLNFYDTLNWVHPAYFDYYMGYAISAYKAMSEIDVRSESYSYTIKFKLVKSDRETIIDVMQTSIPITLNKKGIIIEHLNEYQIIGRGETKITLSTPVLRNKNGEESEINAEISNFFKSETSIDLEEYTETQMLILKIYADNPNITTMEMTAVLAEKMNKDKPYSKNTINTYNVDIMRRTNYFLGTEVHDLNTVRDIALVYRALDLI